MQHEHNQPNLSEQERAFSCSRHEVWKLSAPHRNKPSPLISETVMLRLEILVSAFRLFSKGRWFGKEADICMQRQRIARKPLG